MLWKTNGSYVARRFLDANRKPRVRRYPRRHACPDPRPSPSEGFYANQVICSFACAHDRIGPKNELVGVVVLHAKETREEVLRQVEDAMDKLAELVESGKMVEPAYTFDEGQLILGLPK